MISLIFILLAQIKTSHFERLPMPSGRQWMQQKLEAINYDGDFTVPANGKHKIDYQKLYPGDYTKIPVRCQFEDKTDKATPIYDIDESFSYIVIKSKAGHKIHWSCTMARQKK